MIRLLNFDDGDLVLAFERGSPYTPLGLGGKVTALEGRRIKGLTPLINGCYTISVTSEAIQEEIVQVLKGLGYKDIHYEIYLDPTPPRFFIKPGKFSQEYYNSKFQSVIRFDTANPYPALDELRRRGYKFIVRYGPEYILI